MKKNMDIIRKIKDCIKESNLTQKEISAKLGISEDSMVRYLKGTSQFKLDMLISLSEILQMPLYELLTDDCNDNLTLDEKELIKAYRSATPAMQAAARKLLDVPELSGKLSDYQTGKEAI